jgi:hypothetical protein
MPRQVVARVLLACAVVLAQQSAFAHGLWHAASGPAPSEDGKPAKGKPLCDLHDLLGTVLGALSAAAPQLAAVSLCDAGFLPAQAVAAQGPALDAQSRGPPALS